MESVFAAAYPTEFDEVFGAAPDRLATGIAWPEPARATEAVQAQATHPEKQLAGRPCTGDCGRKAVA
ncbi:MAG TPA: hypothetical protein VHN20_13770, partial [Beijerinckiaceae bacterium]|nr:hypothetical protein [Beijerinckiaceae bacterium]